MSKIVFVTVILKSSIHHGYEIGILNNVIRIIAAKVDITPCPKWIFLMNYDQNEHENIKED